MHADLSNLRNRLFGGLRLRTPGLNGWLALLLAGLALLHGLITLSTLLTSRLDYPLHDEFRINLRYLEHAFPLNVFLLENGHRTIFPGLVRLVDLHHFGGRNLFQMAFAWSLAGFAIAVWVHAAMRHFGRSTAVAAIALVVAFIGWNAQTRMFIHAYETSHLFHTLFGLTLALVGCRWAGNPASRYRGLTLALLGCAYAMFSFGPGVAVFATVFVLLVLQRASWKLLLAVVGAFILCFLLYTFLLPGAEGVRNSTRAFQFAAAPFLFFTRLGSPLHEILSPFLGRDDPRAVLASMLVGLAMLVLMLRHLLQQWRRREALNAWDQMVIGTFVFAAAANFVIVIGRSDYLMENTTQLFADRYLFWGSLTWMAFLLCSLTAADRAGGARAWAVPAAAVLVLWSMLPIGRDLNTWAGSVRREVSLSAAAQFAGHRDDARLARIADAGVEVALAADARMRALRIGHYEGVPGVRRGQTVPFEPRGDLPFLRLHRKPDGLVDTVLDRGHARPWRHRHLLVLDREGRVLASGMLTLSHRGVANRWRIGRPTHDWFEGYWLESGGTPAWLVGERDGRWHPVATLAWQP